MYILIKVKNTITKELLINNSFLFNLKIPNHKKVNTKNILLKSQTNH